MREIRRLRIAALDDVDDRARRRFARVLKREDELLARETLALARLCHEPIDEFRQGRPIGRVLATTADDAGAVQRPTLDEPGVPELGVRASHGVQVDAPESRGLAQRR